MMNEFYFDEINVELSKLEKVIETLPYSQARDAVQSINNVRSLVHCTREVSAYWDVLWEDEITKMGGKDMVDGWFTSPNKEQLTYKDRWSAVYELARRQILKNLKDRFPQG